MRAQAWGLKGHVSAVLVRQMGMEADARMDPLPLLHILHSAEGKQC